MKTRLILLMILTGSCLNAGAMNKEKTPMITLKDSIEINTTMEVGDIVYFEQCVEGVWYKVETEIITRVKEDEGFTFTVKSTTGLGVITFLAKSLSKTHLVFTHTESFGFRESFLGKIGNFLVFKVFFRKQGNWDLILSDMKKDDARLKEIMES